MGFRDYEGINSHHQFILNGKKGFKYADIIICNGEEYYHIIFVKIANEFKEYNIQIWDNKKLKERTKSSLFFNVY